MRKQTFNIVKKALAISLAVLFVVTLTATSVSALDPQPEPPAPRAPPAPPVLSKLPIWLSDTWNPGTGFNFLLVTKNDNN